MKGSNFVSNFKLMIRIRLYNKCPFADRLRYKILPSQATVISIIYVAINSQNVWKEMAAAPVILLLPTESCSVNSLAKKEEPFKSIFYKKATLKHKYY